MFKEGVVGELVTEREFEFSERHFRRIKAFVIEHTGIALTDAKKDMVYGRLSKRVRQQFDGSFDAFCSAIESDNHEEQDFLINAITTNLTAFFRENHHFDHLRDNVIPEILQKNESSRRIRIWSAGCSTGEEPYSIAMTLRAAIKDIDAWDIKILATDLDANVVEHAKAGIYGTDRVSALPKAVINKWFTKGRGAKSGLLRLKPELREMITFKRLNLLHSWPMKGSFDVIFCRNVVIYFDKATQKQLFDRYADILSPDGHLFIGHSETLYKVSDRFSPIGNTIYRRMT